ncbi:NAD(P)-dependent oxidoreductase [Glutamicibacter sp. MNS18]|uniref:NAD-dependent epimerase/dehydratase family protein n=1 Tax=Glutamicibacter sp. MNS18 TaxID=2989817 RepID=UPI002235A073|nr:NAD(P)-dependent oxidoreductase [Glutamicibacter sp. MNS18]MCW4466679.1 NAD(P)-dependent oxidoreductase [Glutamicibacter sp. MNS18]
MAKVIITGGSGRLGRSVVQGFAQAGYQVTSLDRQRPQHPVDGVDYRSVDLLDAAATSELFADLGPDAVVSLAAIAVPFSAPEEVLLTTNAAIAHNVTAAAVAGGARKVVLASSPSIMGYGSPGGWIPERLPLDEELVPRPWHAYGLSKYVAEQIAAMFAAAQGPDGPVRFASFRPCYVIAEEEWAGAATQQGHTVRQRLADPALSAPALFNYVDARDVADFLLLLLEKFDVVDNGSVFFVGAADAMASEPLSEVIPRIYPELADLAAGLTGSTPAFSIDKARRVLGWEPKRSWRTELKQEAAVHR